MFEWPLNKYFMVLLTNFFNHLSLIGSFISCGWKTFIVACWNILFFVGMLKFVGDVGHFGMDLMEKGSKLVDSLFPSFSIYGPAYLLN